MDRRDLLVVGIDVPESENYPPPEPSKTISKIAQNSVISLPLFVGVINEWPLSGYQRTFLSSHPCINVEFRAKMFLYHFTKFMSKWYFCGVIKQRKKISDMTFLSVKNSNSSVISHKYEFQNGCYKKTKHAKFCEKRTFRFSENLVCFVFL